ncbi:hypothetical protein [Amycolatopsis sp.]|uniref:hypothetical protein n=1 Tax=Amycolatopsis sp. TaxID=37632 RepID=UPI002D7EED83|nr:hypothetical protein [Amycolatopsis sp.]HET6704535.1 hypothetical protein [Amycolatopsis sp.]
MTAARLPGWPSPDGLIMHNADAVRTEADFLRLLREILAGSGRTAGKVAAYSGSVLPRSTAYRFVSPANHRLPQYQDQVEAFLSGCGCHPATVDRMAEVWRRLNTGAGGGAELEPREPPSAGALRALPSCTTRQDVPTLPDLAHQDGPVVVHPGTLRAEPAAHPAEFSVSVFRLLEVKLSTGDDRLVRRALLYFLLLMVVFAAVAGGVLATVVITTR